jgi:hypothetical protein
MNIRLETKNDYRIFWTFMRSSGSSKKRDRYCAGCENKKPLPDFSGKGFDHARLLEAALGGFCKLRDRLPGFLG